MAAGAIALPVLDGNAALRNVLTWSSNGALNGNLSPLQAILGVDGVNIASAANAFPVVLENVSVAITAAALPLPAGAATSALQTSGNASLTTIAAAVGASGMAVTAARSGLVTGQQKVAVTSTQAQLTTGSNALANGVRIKAAFGNTAAIVVGLTGVNNTTDGTGNGYILQPGDSEFFQVQNTNALFINGTAGDIVSFQGN